MFYNILIRKEDDVNIEDVVYVRHSKKFAYVIDKFIARYGNGNALIKYNFRKYNIIVKKNLLIIEDFDKEEYNVVLVKTDTSLIIDKTFKSLYPLVFRKFKPIIDDCNNNKLDLVYTDYCGRDLFKDFEMPKFFTITERDEYVNSLLKEVFN